MQKQKLLLTSFLIALLIYPLSLSSQNTFSLSLDTNNSAAGDQAVMAVTTPADQVVAIQVFGSNIQNANGFSLRFEYDTSQVTYQGFDAGSVLPGAAVLSGEETNTDLGQLAVPTAIEIAIVSLSDQVAVNSGLVGTIRFRTTAKFLNTSISLVHGELGGAGNLKPWR